MCSTTAQARPPRPEIKLQALWGLERDRPGSSEVAPMSHPARLLRPRPGVIVSLPEAHSARWGRGVLKLGERMK